MNRQRITRSVHAIPGTPTAFKRSAQGCRSRHAAKATLGLRSKRSGNPNGVQSGTHGSRDLMQPRWGCFDFMPDSQGSACCATLGWMMKRRWRSSSVRSAIFVVRHPIVCPKLRRSGIGGMMSPLRGSELFWDAGFYKDAAPTGLRQAHRPPVEILKALGQLEAEIQQGMKELEGMLK